MIWTISEGHLSLQSFAVLDSKTFSQPQRPKIKQKTVEIGFKCCIASGVFLARLIRLSVRYVTLRVHSTYSFDNI